MRVANNTIRVDERRNLKNILKQHSNVNAAIKAIHDVLLSKFAMPTSAEELSQIIESSPDIAWNPDTSPLTVHTLLSKMKTHKSVGPDNIPPLILYAARDIVAGPLSHLFSLSVQTASVPVKWKKANVLPVPKVPNATVNELRPISLLPIEAKILERCVTDSVKSSLISLFGVNQFGFRPGYSTLHVHLALHDIITSSLDFCDVMGVAIVSFDLTRAFDQLMHDSLLSSLADITTGLPKQFLKWCSSFLSNRQFRVCLNDHDFGPFDDVPSGVPLHRFNIFSCYFCGTYGIIKILLINLCDVEIC